MRLIPLTQGKFAIVDDEDFESVSRFKWHVTGSGYAQTCMQMGRIGGRKKTCYMYLHRFLLHPPKGMEVDHRNHTPLDCRRAEIRISSGSQNQHNQVRRKGTSKWKGVTWYKQGAKWVARIVCNYKIIHLGRFDNELEAAGAYDAAARELFGEFAHTNFPEKQYV